MMRRLAGIVSAVGVTCVGTLPAAAQTVTAQDPASVLGAMQTYGLAATLGKDDKGQPKIEFKIEGLNSTLFFFGCDAQGANCISVGFDVGFEITPPFTADAANTWNQSNRFGAAYSDEKGVARLAMDMNMVGAGVSRDSFDETLKAWGKAIANFKPYIGWQ